MATWVTLLIIADNILEKIPTLCRHEFCVGNIAPDCNVENKDHYPKYVVVTLDELASYKINGVKIVHLANFLLNSEAIA